MKPVDPIFQPLLDHAAGVSFELELRAALERLPGEIKKAAAVVVLHPHDQDACRRWAELCVLRHQAIAALKKCTTGNNSEAP